MLSRQVSLLTKYRCRLFHTGFAFQQVHRRLREERQADQHHRLRRAGAAVVSRQGGLLVGGGRLFGYVAKQEKCAWGPGQRRTDETAVA